MSAPLQFIGVTEARLELVKAALPAAVSICGKPAGDRQVWMDYYEEVARVSIEMADAVLNELQKAPLAHPPRDLTRPNSLIDLEKGWNIP